jgi:hypothetical protein
MITLFLFALYGVLVGGVGQMREIVKEQDIYKRERLVNLKILPYVLSKVWVAGLLALYQTAWYVLIHFLAFDMPGGLLGVVLVYVTLTLSTMAGMMLGLFASALSPNANSASLLVIVLMIPQIVLGGALIAMPGNGRYISAIMTTRWSFEALMSITEVGSDVAADLCWTLPNDLRESLSLDAARADGCRCLGTNLFSQCQFPSVGRFYDPAVDEAPPVAPPALIQGQPPPEPVFPKPPEQPVPPANQADQVAMGQYLEALDKYQAQFNAWQDSVNATQAAYEADLKAYQTRTQAEAESYQTVVVKYQKELAAYNIARASAVTPAEGLIYQVNRDFGWTFVNTEDSSAFYSKIVTTWIAQVVYSFVLFLVIIFLQKRKDVV